jgi:hypothetical protein
MTLGKLLKLSILQFSNGNNITTTVLIDDIRIKWANIFKVLVTVQ